MNQLNKLDTSPLDNIITGRVDPKIYAFTTETTPNYLKVGDTYRPLELRLSEWRKYYPDLEKKFEGVAKIDEKTFFRDYAVHSFLEKDIQKERLKQNSIKDIPYYSNEFFKDVYKKDVVNAIEDIKKSYKDNQNKYQYFKFEESRIPLTHIYERLEDYDLRPNQKKTIKKFKIAVDSGGNNLLMYAVMRFGKSFTSMCCAVEIKANIILVVSAKADVQEEWKKTVESHKKFSDYIFLNSKQLLDSDTIVKDKQESGKKIVIFLTLQDLQGKEIKKKHKEIFENETDLLIIDETHFGARAEEYGRVLRGGGLVNKKDVRQELKLNDESFDELDKEVKFLKTKVRLHLSGTPYRILMGGEFKDDDIIAFYQFSDIAEDQKEWDQKNLSKDEVKEWDNPYYGFPQMVRFAFHPNESSRKKMEELKSQGISYALSALLKPQSIEKDNKHNLHKKFVHETEVLDLFRVIDGSKNDINILNFLDYERIKQGKMCRHIVCVMPYRASCDALESMLKNNNFKNLSEYEIVNISGVDGGKKYKTTQSVQIKIKDCESKNRRTITLTVNRMLTGSTVPEWDTMLYFKDTASPQEYDQAVFRLQNQYVRTYTEPSGDTVRFNMKPQTLLVDFNPNRMFEVQEQKALIYNANTDKSGGAELKKQIQRELNVSPIIVLNNNRIKEITPAYILDAVRDYSRDRGVDDEARSIPIDIGLLDFPEIRTEIEKQNEIGSKQGLEIQSVQGEGDNLDTGEIIGQEDNIENAREEVTSIDKEIEEDFRKKFATYYIRILFFAFLTNSKIESVSDILQALKNNKDNRRIIKNLGINMGALGLFQKHINPFIVVELDRKIHNINSLANDTVLRPDERAKIAMSKFSRLSESEVVTPEFVADKVIAVLPAKEIRSSTKILDIASKQGEFVYAIYKKFGKKVANNVYSIPTSKAAYEFTRKIYESLGLNIDNIEKEYTSYQLIEDNKIINGKNVKINNIYMKFDVIVGNPPYQQIIKGRGDQPPIYHHFLEAAYNISDLVTMIHPARFLFNAGLTPKEWNKKMLNDVHLKVIMFEPDATKIFPTTSIPGGIAITYHNKRQTFPPIQIFTSDPLLNSIMHKASPGVKSLASIVSSRGVYRLTDKALAEIPIIESIQSKGHSKDIGTSAFEILKDKVFFETKPVDGNSYIQMYGLMNSKRTFLWMKKSYLDYPASFDQYKIFISKANGAALKNGTIVGELFVADKSVGATETFLTIGGYEHKTQAENLAKYIKTKFVRVLVSILKATPNNTRETWSKVPLQDFTDKSDIDWSKSIPEIDKQLYAKYKLDKKEIDFIETHVKAMS